MSFTFKRFHVDDSNCAMKVGTDGVLLGTWARLKNVKTILDIGAGSGILSLICAERTDDTRAKILAVEVDSEAGKDCVLNFENSPWKERLQFVNADFREIKGNFDVIISNPPFFTGDLASPSHKRELARQGSTLNYNSLIEFSANSLTPSGHLEFISNAEAEKEILFCLVLNGFHIQRQTYVRDNPEKTFKRILWDVSFSKCESPKITELSIRENGMYTNEYRAMTRDLYLDI